MKISEMNFTKKKTKFGGIKKSKMKFSRYRSVIIEKKTFLDETRSKRIAVVGNSQSLFNSEYGSSIDDHDLVIRFNKPAIFMCDYDVSKTHGTKFNFWGFWSIGAFKRDILDKEDCNIFLKTQFYENKSLRKIQTSTNGHASLTRDHIDYTFNRNAYLKLGNSLKQLSANNKVTPSVGISVLEWLRYSNPQHVSIYGMDFKKTPTFSEIDRYKNDMNGQFDTRCMHNFAAEEQYTKEIILKDRRFEFFQ